MSAIRQAAVAGTFYPDDPRELAATVRACLDEGASRLGGGGTPQVGNERTRRPKAIVAPHAGYAYSGPVAGTAFAALAASQTDPAAVPSTPPPPIRRAVIIGPSHVVAFPGIAVPSATAFATPLGPVAVDEEAIAALTAHFPFVRLFDRAHAREHALEVELPFLVAIAGPDIRIVPLVVGDASAREVAAVLEHLWGGDETVIVVSSDLSHYHSYQKACAVDRGTASRITAMESERLSGDLACGFRALRGLLEAGKRRGMSASLLDLRNSGDTAGPRDRVVGYGAFAFREGADRP